MVKKLFHALYPLEPVATLRFCHLRPRCVSKQRRTTNVIISDRVWWIWCDAGLATVATRPQRSPHSVASNSRPDYFAATRSRSLFLTINECCVSAAAAAIWEIQWRRSTPQLAPVDTGGHKGAASSLHKMKSTVPNSLHHTSDSLSLRSKVSIVGLYLFNAVWAPWALCICIASEWGVAYA